MWPSRPFSEIVSDRTSGQKKLARKNFSETGRYPVIDQGREFVSGFSDDESLLYTGNFPVVLFGDHTRELKFVDSPFILGADGVKILEPKHSVEAKFLYYGLLNANVPANGYSRHFKFLKELQILTPPRKIQRQIVDILDQADALRRKRREANALHDRILPALFHRRFGDIASTDCPWPMLSLPECGIFVSGATPSKDDGRFWGGDVFWVTPKDMKVPAIHESKIRTSATALAETNLKLVDPGHILLVVRGMILARHVPVAINRAPVTINQDMKAIRPIPDLEPEFLRSCLQVLESVILARMGTAAHGTRKLGQEEMREIRIPVPPQNLQGEFSEVARSFEAGAPKRQKATENLETLFQTLLARAFDGRLFPDNVADARNARSETDELLQEIETQSKP